MIIFFAIASILGFISAKLAELIDFCFNEGNLLDNYYLFLIDHVKPKYPKLSKPLGLCIKCMSIWICLILSSLFFWYLEIPFIYIFISIAINFYEINKLK